MIWTLLSHQGLGSTHDDITYEVISKYFNVDCKLDKEVVDRMNSIRGDYLNKLNPEQKNAFYRMATIPYPTPENSSVKVEKYFLDDKLWFPIVELNEQVYILPESPSYLLNLYRT